MKERKLIVSARRCVLNIFSNRRESVEVSEHLASNVLFLCFGVIHYSVGRGQDDATELSARKNVGDELLEVLDLEVVSGRDDSALVQPTVQLNDDLSVPLVVDDFELVDVSYSALTGESYRVSASL